MNTSATPPPPVPPPPPPPPPFPFTAIVGQDDLRLALLLNAIDPRIGGVLIRGERGTAKSTAARGLAALGSAGGTPARPPADKPSALHSAAAAPFIELPLGATEDRVIGALDLEPALREGRRRLRPGLLAQADGGVLYVDEVNLLPDHLVDLLLDAAASGCVRVERDGISESAPARFILIGSMNPEEGELRPQFLDRFGLCVRVATHADHALRVETLRRRLAYEADPRAFVNAEETSAQQLRARLAAARARLPAIPLDDATLAQAAALCAALKLDGARGDLALVRAARAIAAWENAPAITDAHLRHAARLALPHRTRKKPFEPVKMETTSSRFDTAPTHLPKQNAAPTHPKKQDAATPLHEQDAAATPPGNAHVPRAGAGVPPVPLSCGNAGQNPQNADTPQPDADATVTEKEIPPPDAAAIPVPGAIHLALDTPPPARATAPGHRAAAGRRDTAARPAGEVIRSAPLREGGSLALAPTLTAAAARTSSDAVAGQSGSGVPPLVTNGKMPLPPAPALALHRADLRQHERAKRGAARVLFIVDASGSMSAQHRLALAKGAATGLLAGSYQKRDEVALLLFHGETATLAVPFTRDVDRVERALRDAPTGGRTPLAAALTDAAALLAARGPALLVVFTDGRANVPHHPGADPWREALAAARALAPAAAGALVVDCETGPVALGRARDLAAALEAECEHLAALDEPALTLRIRNQLAS
ncbi:MAG: VWA domain-containing protein [Opitutaceae bacterium]|jgi:magnesium chelatase subunit D|nr:VWA domain-containing protein [Opitutaceae bacterium]